MSDPLILFLILLATLFGFVLNKIRYDLVALLALLATILFGIVKPEEAFNGFGHPAVITVAAILVISRGFFHSGLVDFIATGLTKVGNNTVVQLLALTSTVAFLSAFMNNVGALALLLPVAVRMARDSDKPPSLLLMPLAFGSLLGGLTTLIGTPPNVIIANYWGAHSGTPFGMFSFTPVGLGIAVAGVLFISLFGWWFLPTRKAGGGEEDWFEIDKYLSELTVTEDSKACGMTVPELGKLYDGPLPVIAILRDDRKIPLHSFYGVLRDKDVLLIEADPDDIKKLAKKGGLEIGNTDLRGIDLIKAEDLEMVEAVVRNDSNMIGRSAQSLNLLSRYGLRLLAVARDGQRLNQPLSKMTFRTGDVLLLQGSNDQVREGLQTLGCLPLAKRDIGFNQPRKLVLSTLLFGTAITATVAGFLPAQVAFLATALAMILTGILHLRDAYDAIDWPIIILLGAMIPVGGALESTGGAQALADGLLYLGASWPPVITLCALFLVTMFLSDIINNAAATVLMAPIAIGLAEGLSVAAEPFLMAVAIAASCAFLTPIGHQSNTLVLGPGGYRFGDYWRLGLPLEIIIFVLAIPLLLYFWPL